MLNQPAALRHGGDRLRHTERYSNRLNDAHYLASRLRRIGAQLPHLPRTFTLVWTAARGWTLAWVALLAAQGLLPVATVYLTRSLVDALVAAIRTHGGPLNCGRH